MCKGFPFNMLDIPQIKKFLFKGKWSKPSRIIKWVTGNFTIHKKLNNGIVRLYHNIVSIYLLFSDSLCQYYDWLTVFSFSIQVNL